MKGKYAKGWKGPAGTKFMQVLAPKIWKDLKKIAKLRGITVQELIRVLIVPDWMRNNPEEVARAKRSRK